MTAHDTALKNGLSTIIVLPEGISHFSIRKELQPVWDINRVLVISEFLPSDQWMEGRAMQRNKKGLHSCLHDVEDFFVSVYGECRQARNRSAISSVHGGVRSPNPEITLQTLKLYCIMGCGVMFLAFFSKNMTCIDPMN